jgi:transcriptional regulator with XRE-family HTH domain
MSDIHVLNKEKTGLVIRSLMDKHKINYEDLADQIGLNSPRVIFEWINGKKMPKMDNVIKLKFIFNVTIEELLVIE